MPNNNIIIDVSGVTKRFGPKTVVNGLDLQVRQGEIYGFLGPNGSGKTTFLRMLCGLLVPDEGSGTCLGYDIVKQSRQIKPQVGYMAQHFSLYSDLTVQENLNFVASLYGIKDLAKARNEVMERLELGPFGNQLAGTLSGGWKQRLALGCCLIHGPKLLLLDEPTAGVDPKARREFWDQVHRLTGEGITALITTHYMDEAERCHRLGYIAYGDLLAKGTVNQVIENEGLTTWAVSGEDLYELSRQMESLAGVDQVAPFGNTLHISGRDADALKKAIEPFMTQGRAWREVDTSLEEVFIDLMQRSGAKP